MNDQKVGFLEEAPGKKSVMRLLALVIVVSAIAMGFTQIIMHEEANETLVIGMIGAGLGAKAWQKSKEKTKSSST